MCIRMRVVYFPSFRRHFNLLAFEFAYICFEQRVKYFYKHLYVMCANTRMCVEKKPHLYENEIGYSYIHVYSLRVQSAKTRTALFSEQTIQLELIYVRPGENVHQ